MEYINYTNRNINNIVNASENEDRLFSLMEPLDNDDKVKNIFSNNYLFSKLVSICIKKGKKKMAYKNVLLAFQLIKTFFRLNSIFFLKIAILQIEPFIFLHKIPRGKKEIIYPRILPVRTRIHNALFIIVNQAFKARRNFRFFYISLAYSILENSTLDNIYKQKVKEFIEIAELNKRNIKYRKKRKGKPMISKIRRRERFKLFKKIKHWK
jgi:ribosomal protein S7